MEGMLHHSCVGGGSDASAAPSPCWGSGLPSDTSMLMMLMMQGLGKVKELCQASNAQVM